MKWTQEALNKLPIRDGYRLRSENMTRLEVFSDTAFAFAMTMLVVSVGVVPDNFNELVLALKSVPAFLLSFSQIAFFGGRIVPGVNDLVLKAVPLRF